MPEVKDSEVVLKVEHLKKYFPMGKHAVLKAVDDVSFEMKRRRNIRNCRRIRLWKDNLRTYRNRFI